MSAIEATGERYLPDVMAGDVIDAEHQARYRLVLPHVSGRIVLDAGCGVGWGSALMLAAGASTVIGVDNDRGAIDDASLRAPGGRFLVGDLMALPFDDDAVDVVVCLEALEHTADASRTLDELVRVLRPEGMLVVSSPNPAVYPAGNPFHVHELSPDDLLDEVRSRLPHVVRYRQHLLVSSLVRADDAPPGPGPLEAGSWIAVSLGAGHDPYSLVVASATGVERPSDVQVLVPSHQLDQLDQLATGLADEREEIQKDHQRIVWERADLLADRDGWRSRADELTHADEALRQRSSMPTRGCAA